MKITLPFPDMQRLHAHAKGNSRYTKSKATKEARQLACYAATDMLNRKLTVPLIGRVLVSYAIYVPDNRERDECNMLQACKPYVDGLVDAGLCGGDSWQKMSLFNVFVEIDREDPRVEITLNGTLGKGDMMAVNHAD